MGRWTQGRCCLGCWLRSAQQPQHTQKNRTTHATHGSTDVSVTTEHVHTHAGRPASPPPPPPSTGPPQVRVRRNCSRHTPHHALFAQEQPTHATRSPKPRHMPVPAPPLSPRVRGPGVSRRRLGSSRGVLCPDTVDRLVAWASAGPTDDPALPPGAALPLGTQRVPSQRRTSRSMVGVHLSGAMQTTKQQQGGHHRQDRASTTCQRGQTPPAKQGEGIGAKGWETLHHCAKVRHFFERYMSGPSPATPRSA